MVKRITNKMLTGVPVAMVFRLAVEHGRDAMPLYERWLRLNVTDGSVSADTDSLRQSGVSADTVLAPSVGSPTVREAN